MKNNKGITLLVLVITVIVILILAAATLLTLQRTGLIGRAQEARDKYGNAVVEEQGILENSPLGGGAWDGTYYIEGDSTNKTMYCTISGNKLLAYESYTSSGQTYTEDYEYTIKIENNSLYWFRENSGDNGQWYKMGDFQKTSDGNKLLIISISGSVLFAQNPMQYDTSVTITGTYVGSYTYISSNTEYTRNIKMVFSDGKVAVGPLVDDPYSPITPVTYNVFENRIVISDDYVGTLNYDSNNNITSILLSIDEDQCLCTKQ